MLQEIKLESFVIFDNFSLNMQSGMTAITGSTGSGKSILFDAVEFALGYKLKRKIQNASVTLKFHYNNEELKIKHCKKSSSKFYINDHAVNRLEVQKLAVKLVCFQRQNQHLQSLDNLFQRHVLDKYANINLSEVNSIFEHWLELKSQLKQKQAELDLLDQDLNQHYLSELQELEPSFDDWRELNAKIQAAKNSQKLQSVNVKSKELISSISADLLSAMNLQICGSNIEKLLQEAYTLIQEVEHEINDVTNQQELTPYEMEKIELRIQEYFRLARKHKVKPESLPDTQEHYQEVCDQMIQSQREIINLQVELEKLAFSWTSKAQLIAQIRQNHAKKLELLFEDKLCALGMSAKVKLNFEFLSSNVGLDAGGNLEFLIATKFGQPLKPVHQVLSGGEAARVSLVMQEILSETNNSMTYLMDEVDVGVSGAVASGVGVLLKSIAQKHQVLCITHTPQVAALAQQHISMSSYKRLLSYNERVEEIAAMLSHSGITDTAKQQAQSLLE